MDDNSQISYLKRINWVLLFIGAFAIVFIVCQTLIANGVF